MIKPDDALFHWFSDHKEQLATTGIELEFKKHPGASSAYLDFVSDSWMGRATVWKTGECDCELLSETGEQILWQHHDWIEGDGLEPLLELLVYQIINQRIEAAG